MKTTEEALKNQLAEAQADALTLLELCKDAVNTLDAVLAISKVPTDGRQVALRFIERVLKVVENR